MIRRRTVILLGTVTLLTTVGASLAVINRASETRSAVESIRLYPGLEDRAADVKEVQVVRAEGAEHGTVTLMLSAAGWTLKERDGYPVRTDLVRKLLFDLGQIDLIERKTAEPAHYDRLDLRDVAKKGSKASRVVVSAGDGKPLVDLYVGKKRESQSGGKPMVYVRKTGEPQTYLAEGDLDLRGGPIQWLPREIVNVPKDTISSVVLTSAKGDVLKLDRAGNDFKLADIPAGRKLKSQYTVNNAATVIDKMLFDDVRSAKGLTFDPALGQDVFTTKDGLTVTIAFAADPQAAATTDDASKAGDAKAGDDKAKKPSPWLRVQVTAGDGATDDARKLAEKFAKQTDGWAYRVSSYDLERLQESAESLTKPAEGS